MPTVAQLRRAIADRLREAGKPEGEARTILSRVLEMSPAEMVAGSLTPVPPEAEGEINATVERRLAGEPLDMIVGEREFFGRAFAVNADVLSPRDDTEVLVRRALELLDGVEAPRVLDLGTGSGAIAVTVLLERPDASALAVDISPHALLVAEENAERHGVAGRLDLVEGSWFEHVEGRFDAVASNPPYVTDAAMRDLATEVADWDPALALAGGVDGMDAYRVIAGEARTHLQPGAPLLLEIGHDLGVGVADLLLRAGFERVDVSKDLAGHDRVVEGFAPRLAEVLP